MIAHLSTVVLFAGLAAAVHTPVGEPLGNAITAPLIEVVPACKEYTIKWTPSTPNTVSILLLRGPSTNVVQLGAPLVEGIANSGSFQWTPASTLEADSTHYGLQLIDDVTGQYQYSTQFGISKDACKITGVSSSVVVSTTEAPAKATGGYYGYPAPISKTSSSSSTTTKAGYQALSSSVAPQSSATPNTVIISSVASSGYPVASSGYPAANSTLLQPSKSLSVPASLQTSATTAPPTGTSSAPAESTGGASGIRAGFGLAAAVAGLVFIL